MKEGKVLKPLTAGEVQEPVGRPFEVLKPLTVGEIREFLAGLLQQVPVEVFQHPEFIRRCNRHRSFLGGILREAFHKYLAELPMDTWLALWQRVYWEICGIEPQFQDVQIPEDPGGFGWLIVATPEVSLNSYWKGLINRFSCWCHYGNNLEEGLGWNRQQRSYRDGAYAVRLRDRIEADEEMKCLSANVLETRGDQFITLDERVRLEGFYWVVSNGKHLDIQNRTLCAGSRSRSDQVPDAGWYGDDYEFRVCLSNLDLANSDLRARQVVSVPKQQ